MQRLTQNQSSKSYVDGADKELNVQAVAEALGGLASGEGYATWTASNSLVVSDTRVVSSSRIKLCGARTSAPIGFWYVSSVGSGTFTITSTETELAGTVAEYIVVNK